MGRISKLLEEKTYTVKVTRWAVLGTSSGAGGSESKKKLTLKGKFDDQEAGLVYLGKKSFRVNNYDNLVKALKSNKWSSEIEFTSPPPRPTRYTLSEVL